MKQLSDCGKKIEELSIKAFYYYGLMVARYPKHFLLGSLLFTAIAMTGLPSARLNLDLYELFVPLDAPARSEYERLEVYRRMPTNLDHFKVSSNVSTRNKRQLEIFKEISKLLFFLYPVRIDMIRFYAVHEQYKNLLQSDILNKIYNYTEEILNTTKEHNGKIYRFEDFCHQDPDTLKCSNSLNTWLKHAAVIFKDGKTNYNPNFQLSYPVMYLFNRPKDIGQVVYGVNVTGRRREISSAKVITIHWYVNFVSSPEKERAYVAFREELSKFWLTKKEESQLNFIAHK
ncbi:unnamed protein product [Thelazia callipaeda]|uniref:Uncharacterized protein n=1 Tax=Thelazia callipaeda TaxID=103827 RepID=A0A0N5CRF9_THECL|nr:unnamed protein product [Thelazia callipaeda]